RKRHSLGHCRMVHEHVVHFPRRDLFPATVDDLLQAPRDEQITIGVEIATVAGPEPVLSKGLPVGLWVVVITLYHPGSADDDLAAFSHWQQSASLIHDAQLDPCRHADRTELARTRRQWIAGDLRHSLGDPVAL